MGNLALVYMGKLEPVHLRKDVGLFPIYLSKYFNETTIIYPNNSSELPVSYRNVKLVSMNICIEAPNKYEILRYFNKLEGYIRKENITHVMFFHYCTQNLLFFYELKKRNSELKLYLKLDAGIHDVQQLIMSQSGFKRKLSEKFMNSISLITEEIEKPVKLLNKDNRFKNKIFYAPNGYDDVLVKTVDFSQKKHQMITVGRLGTPQKNTKLILDILRVIDLKDWNVKLIGPVEENFKFEIERFYDECPDKRSRVLFTGPENNPEKLSEIYRESSIFILTSRWEGSALVLIEAAINGDYILTTDVGAARDISTEYNLSFICPESEQGKQNEEKMIQHFSAKLQNIINGVDIIDEDAKKQMNFCRSEKIMSKICSNKFYKDWSE